MIALFLLLVIAAIVLGTVGVAAKGLLYLLIIGIAVFLVALILAALRMRRRPGRQRRGVRITAPASMTVIVSIHSNSAWPRFPASAELVREIRPRLIGSAETRAGAIGETIRLEGDDPKYSSMPDQELQAGALLPQKQERRLKG